MAQIFSNPPYFDDYDENKNFEKVLFKPGRAVQSRELNQLQTISQKQIERFGNYVFKEGSIVSGIPLNVQRTNSIKIYDTDSLGALVDVSLFFKGCTITGLTSGLKGVVRTAVDGVETDVNTKTIVFEFSGFNDTSVSSLRNFILDELIRVEDPDGVPIAVVRCLNGTTFTSLGVEIGDGVLFLGGVFVKHTNQYVLLSRYDREFNGAVGVQIVESTVSSDDDESLLDPALGSSNYFATGADRYKASTIIATRTLAEIEETETSEFFTLLTFENGIVSKSLENPQLNLLLDEMAKRTFEESGNYTVVPFTLRIREHLDNGTNGGIFTANTTPVGNISQLAIGVEPGVGYVNGYRFQNLVTQYLTVDKGIDISSEQQQPIAFNYGNYVNINEVVGPWDVDNGVLVSLRSSNARSITNETYGVTAAPGSEIGTARVKSLVYESGTAGLASAEYRLYLYDIALTANVPFSNVKSVFFNASSGADSLADIVLTSNIAVLNESSFNTGIFRFPQTAIKTLRDVNGNLDNAYIFKKNFDVTIAADGTFTVNSPIANEEFPFGSGALNNTQKRESIYLALKSAVVTNSLSGNISFSANSDVITGTSTSFTTQLKVGDRISVEGNVFRVAVINSNANLIISGNVGNQVATNVDYAKQFGSGEIIDLSINGSSGSARAVSLVTDTQLAFDIQEDLATTVDAKIMIDVQRTDGQEASKVLNQNRYVKIDCSTNVAGTSGFYNLGFSDVFRIVAIYHGTTYSESNTNVTDEFIFNNGQKETIYSHGRISLKSGSTLSLSGSSKLLVKLDFFSHSFSTGTGYFSVDSYPIDDTGLTAGTIRTEQIPVFFGTNEAYDLRNCIDIRPRLADTATNATSIGSATENPALPSAIIVPSGGLRVPVVNEQFLTDLDFFLGRVDRVYVDESYNFNVDRGVPGFSPNAKDSKPNSMTLGLIFIPPFPSLPQAAAREADRFDYSTSITLVDNRRYTMRDIGNLNKRVDRIEYYSALNLLELQAKELVIPSDLTGLNRFKNGFLVDAFTGHNIGNVLDPAYKCSIDYNAKELRPSFLVDNINLTLNKNLSSHIQTAPNDVTLTVSGASGEFPKFGIVSQGGVTGNILQYSDDKIYLQEVSGTFSSNTSITSNAGGTATVTNVFTQPDGSLVTLPYVSRVCTINPYATKTRNCAEHLTFQYIGEVELNPPYDNWIDTNINPELVVNFDNNYDNFVALDRAFGTKYDDWSTSGFSSNYNGKVSSEKFASIVSYDSAGGAIAAYNQTIVGNRTRYEKRYEYDIIVSTPGQVVYNLGDRVIDVSTIPFIRAQTIFFEALSLQPNTRVYPFFDGEDVSRFCFPVNGVKGDPLITNDVGQLIGGFNLPNNDSARFRTGSRLFVLSDDIQNRGIRFSRTYASKDFQASGVLQTKEITLLSTRNAKVELKQTQQTREIVENVTWVERVQRYIPPPPPPSGDGGDPVAQTFEINGTSFESGIFITRIQLYFQTKHPTLPITIQIRETVNGYPGRRTVPFSTKTLYPEDIHISDDASLATIFTYTTPVYLNPGVEYALVVLPAGNNTGYELWVSELGGIQINSDSRVSSQPLVGVFFTSANDSAWSAVQNEDMKIVIYRALFDTTSSGTVVLENSNEDYVTISNLNNTFDAGSNVFYSNGLATIMEYDTIGQELTLLKHGTGAVKAKVIGTGNITTTSGNTIIVGNGTLFTTEAYANAVIFSSNTSTRIGKILSVNSDSVITLTAGAAESVSGNSFIIYDELSDVSNAEIRATVESLNSKYFSLFDTNLGTLGLLKTTDAWEYKARDNSSNLISSFEGFSLNNNYELESEARIDSASTEDSIFSGVKSFTVKSTFSSEEIFVSPALDTGRMSTIIVDNVINNDSSNETTNSGNAEARYISKEVILDADQDAEDLKVFLTAYKPPLTDIKLFVKLLNANDGTAFADRTYIEMERVTSSLVVSDAKFDSDYLEYEFRLPNSVMTGPFGEVQYTESGNTYTGYKSFAIKIVMLSADPAVYPKVKNYRAISVQI